MKQEHQKYDAKHYAMNIVVNRWKCPYIVFVIQGRMPATIAWIQEIEQRMEQLPGEVRQSCLIFRVCYI